MSLSYDTYRLTNNDIRPASSPQDLTIALRQYENQPTVTVPFQPGTKVYAIPMKELIVDSNGEIDTGDMTAGVETRILLIANSISEMF